MKAYIIEMLKATKCSVAVALTYLDKYNWDIHKAIQAYLVDNPNIK